MTLPTTAQIEALGLSEREALALVSALVLLQVVPAEKLEQALIDSYDIDDSGRVHEEAVSDILCSTLALRRLLPERPAARRQDDARDRIAQLEAAYRKLDDDMHDALMVVQREKLATEHERDAALKRYDDLRQKYEALVLEYSACEDKRGEAIKRAEEAERELAEAGAILAWTQDAIDGKPVSEFALSFPQVRAASDLSEQVRHHVCANPRHTCLDPDTDDGECPACAVGVCPHSNDDHLHHDGCPCCYFAEQGKMEKLPPTSLQREWKELVAINAKLVEALTQAAYDFALQATRVDAETGHTAIGDTLRGKANAIHAALDAAGKGAGSNG